MNFKLTPTQSLFKQMIREFAEKEVKPLAAEIDEQERFPIETVQKRRWLRSDSSAYPSPLNTAGQEGTTSCTPSQ